MLASAPGRDKKADFLARLVQNRLELGDHYGFLGDIRSGRSTNWKVIRFCREWAAGLDDLRDVYDVRLSSGGCVNMRVGRHTKAKIDPAQWIRAPWFPCPFLLGRRSGRRRPQTSRRLGHNRTRFDWPVTNATLDSG